MEDWTVDGLIGEKEASRRDQVLDLGNHAPRRRCVIPYLDAIDAIEPEADQGLTLVVGSADGTPSLFYA
jgi:hypothetical protein